MIRRQKPPAPPAPLDRAQVARLVEAIAEARAGRQDACYGRLVDDFRGLTGSLIATYHVDSAFRHTDGPWDTTSIVEHVMQHAAAWRQCEESITWLNRRVWR